MKRNDILNQANLSSLDAATHDRPVAGRSMQSEPPRGPLRILIVDDSAITRAVIRRSIKIATTASPRPVTMAEACDGAEGLDKLRAEPFDVCFLDLNMPRMGGLEMARAVFADGTLSTAIVIVSSESMSKKIAQLKQEGVRGYIRKPFAPEQIRDMLQLLADGGELPNRIAA